MWRSIFFALPLALVPDAAADDGSMGAKMRAASEALIASVDDRRRAKLVLSFADPARTDWHYTPRSRPGLCFAELGATERDAVHKLLRLALSAAGHRRVVNIIELELVLREIETFGALMRDPEKYCVVFFGRPDARAPWGWRFEGHHLSLNFTLRGDAALATTPSFFGANPAEVRAGPKRGLRVLAPEEDEARALLALLDERQRTAVVVDARSYGDIVTANKAEVSPLENRGLEVKAMTPAQRAQLRKLVEVYASTFEAPIAAARMARVDEGFEAARFAWAGPTEKGKPHYYRIQGSKFLIEYDASQNDGNHVHTVWRDFSGDFGRDLLKDHYSEAKGTSHRH